MARAVSGISGIVVSARDHTARLWLLIAAAGGLAVLALLAPQREMQIAAAVAGATLVSLVLVLRGLVVVDRWMQRRQAANLALLVGQDAAPCFVTDEVGEVSFQNEAAVARFGERDGATLVAALHDHFASPSAVLFRLQNRAAHAGAAREDVVTRRGHTRLSVHRLDEGRFLWRLEEFLDRGTAGRGAETLSLPMLTANKSGVVLFTNEAMRRLLGGRPKRLDRIFTSPVFRSGEEIEVSAAEGPVRAVVAEIEGSGERREIYLLPVGARTETEVV
ncbi:MAG: hybrid sensor histidine kinase/response regulator, partial [Paracoccaceae bacterium]